MKKNNYIQLFVTGWILFLVVALAACSDEYADAALIGKRDINIDLSLSVPGLTPMGTKAMNTNQESSIDDTKIQVLVFEQTGSTEVYRYKAEITNRDLPMLKLKVPTSSGGEKYRLVVLANVDPMAIGEGASKEAVLQQFTFNCMGKWNASSTAPSKFPMWGELNELITFQSDRYVNILLHRALARVDVGVLFKFNNPDPVTGQDYPQKDTDKESVYGMDKFKIKDIRVYRTLNKAYAASSANFMTGNEVTTPWIPANAKYNSNSGAEYATLVEADQHPLVYTLPAGGNSYVREIYIPESGIINAQSNMDNVPCIVVGGYYGSDNTTNITYYRADFANYNNGAVSAFLPILRNHQYVFDIHSVNGPGFETPEQALNSITSPMQLTVVEWNQIPLGFYVQGHYYVNIQEKNIWLEGLPLGEATDITYTVPFESNLELDGSVTKQFSLTWGSAPEARPFDVTVDYVKKEFVFKAKNSNTGPGGDVLRDSLFVEVENFKFVIKVNQKLFNISYNLICDSVKVFGVYREDIPLNYSNYISLSVSSTTPLQGAAYEIKTIEENGIYFYASGSFGEPVSSSPGKYVYTIKLEGQGTPVNEKKEKVLKPFEVIIVSNSMEYTECSTKIIMAYKAKRILTIGANAIYRYGYMLEPNSASRAFVDASINFGTTPKSTVVMEENQNGNAFTIEVMTVGQGMVGEVINYNYLKNILNTFKPEIILTGQAINFYTGIYNTDVIDLLSSFVDAGGVFLMCNEFYPNTASIQAMVQKIMGVNVIGDNQSIGLNQLFTLSGNVDDPIANGPFGDMRGKNWGADGHEMHGFSGLPSSDVIVYSTRTDGKVNMFRHKSKGFFFMGEGGFISNPQRYIGGTYQGSYVYCPFAIDGAYRPIPRTNFTTSMNQPVYNSQIFGNIIAWAISYYEENGIAYPESGNKF
ncbi:hypothetical protein [Massilibacteroides vaginae]|uniref:hypothetical protein n=1 Tax=Massilibacteroides vaginae TaxID=1673718 RepID=UPI000A1CD4D7|nr:hypothetical protein [Massilibacteroides vaginae]